MSTRLLTVSVRYEHDIVGARQRAREISAALGFDATEQTRIATAVSELARNAFQYAGRGTVHYGVEGVAAPQVLTMAIVDQGTGIARLDDVLAGRYKSSTGMGLGIVGTRRLMDHFDVVSTAAGTNVTIRKLLPRRAKYLSPQQLGQLADDLARRRPSGPLEEVQQQNQELMRTLDELRARQDELERVNRELEDTNRGVVALYAELDERADHLRRADELKTRFLSNMTHEFRTPVNSILALTGLLAERLSMGPEQKDEVFYIRKSAQQLSDIVDDLLDIAKVEAGKIELRPATFEVQALFGALRGMLRPLLVNQSVTLVFDEPEDLPPILSDESKVSQVLRNFISNALKYTERGEVRVSARLMPARDSVEFAVADTGIGIPEEHISDVFEEFVQIENPLQRRVKGTGLGLPLSKRLAGLLGGEITVESTLGLGSVFRLTIPLILRTATTAPVAVEPGRTPVLVVEDTDEGLLWFQRALSATRFQVIPAHSEATAASALAMTRPAAIVLDLRLHGHDSWDLLAKLKRQGQTESIPLIVVSALDDRQKGFALGADAYGVKPITREWLTETLDALVPRSSAVRVLTVDDEETARFIIREMLPTADYEVLEATSGRDGLKRAREVAPDVVLLDMRLGDMSGAELSERLREDPATASVPIIVVTSQRLSSDDERRLGSDCAVLSKSALTRDALRTAIRQAVSSTNSANGPM